MRVRHYMIDQTPAAREREVEGWAADERANRAWRRFVNLALAIVCAAVGAALMGSLS